MPDNPVPPMGEIVLYQTEDGRTRLECRFADETLWLSQALMAELFQKDVRTINEHLQNVFEEGELDPGRTIRKFRIVRREGAREVAREIEHYNLDAILAVGYRVRSERGTQFRRWATVEKGTVEEGTGHLLGAKCLNSWMGDSNSWRSRQPVGMPRPGRKRLACASVHQGLGSRRGVSADWAPVPGCVE